MGGRGGGGRTVTTEREVLRGRGYELAAGPRLGEGRYSKVRKAMATETATPVAVKILDRTRLNPDFYHRFLEREIRVLRRIRHPFICACYDSFEVGQKVFVVLELGSGGDLLTLVQRRGAQAEAASRRWASQLASALQYLHANQIAHRDVKLENILVTGPEEELRVADFTFVCELESSTDLSLTFCGSKAYSCSEILSQRPYSPFKADVFAAGVVVFILLVGRMPFNEHVPSRADIIRQHEAGRHLRTLANRQPAISAPAVAFVSALLSVDPDLRPTMDRAMEHEWLRGAIPPVSQPTGPIVTPDLHLPQPQASETNIV